ncbi:hypothetical protein AC578_5018 [Pseudocercospora eumusae]|uniref:Glucose-methanol-choline oxidoreductase N-terminal domain-containing protein n=1 Tax=Pseudocercospora eumusae TaxID=321146 RepID=A0A139GX78_9PEZI|nr:hypothetical protein AC578_5018 [Pseudocercospora eumusae]
MSETFDYIIAVGGLSGCVAAFRDIVLVEAGRAICNDPDADEPLGDGYKVTFMSTPQAQLNNRTISLQVGKALGGASAVNYGG